MAYIQSKRRKRRKTNLFKRRFIALFVCLFFIFGLFVASLHLAFWRIANVDIEGVERVDPIMIQQEVVSLVKKDEFNIIPTDNILFVNKEKIRTFLQDKYPQVLSVEVNRNFFSSLGLRIIEREPKSVFCTKDACFWIDESGILFEETVLLDKQRPIYSSARVLDLGDEFMSKDSLEELEVLISSLNKRGLVVEKVREISSHTIVLTIENGTKLVIKKEDSYDDVYNTLVKLLDLDAFRIDKKEGMFKNEFSYINLKFGNKIFYCLRGAECESNY